MRTRRMFLVSHGRGSRGGRHRAVAIGTIGAIGLSMAGAGYVAEAGADGEFQYLGHTQNATIGDTLTALSEGACADAAGAAPLEANSHDGATFDQQLQLLAGQDALPNMMMAPGTPSLTRELIDNGQLEDLAPHLEEAGLTEEILPAARSTIAALYGPDGLYVLPTEFNIEGIWYNKQIFEDNGVEIPATWDELATVVDTLTEADVQPFATPGLDAGWTITRFVGLYLLRTLGPDALQRVADGEASLTDPDYVVAAEQVAALGEAGAFGEAPGSIDYNTAINQFLVGDTAMLYMGSWALSNFNDPEQNAIGEDNIGYMPFPAVTDGVGSIDQVPANVGIPVAFGASAFDSGTEPWLPCIVENYGETALSDSGVITGFVIDEAPADLPPLTQAVQEVINNATESVLWFEALFSPEATTLSQQSAASLATGTMSPEEFMESVQDANQS